MPHDTISALPLRRKIVTNGSYWQMMYPPPVAAKIIASPRYVYGINRSPCSSHTGTVTGFSSIKSWSAPCGQTAEQNTRPNTSAKTSGTSPNTKTVVGTPNDESASPCAIFWMLPIEQMQPFRQNPKYSTENIPSATSPLRDRCRSASHEASTSAPTSTATSRCSSHGPRGSGVRNPGRLCPVSVNSGGGKRWAASSQIMPVPRGS